MFNQDYDSPGTNRKLELGRNSLINVGAGLALVGSSAAFCLTKYSKQLFTGINAKEQDAFNQSLLEDGHDDSADGSVRGVER